MSAFTPQKMSLARIRERLTEGARQLALNLDKTALERLTAYFLELGKWNRKMNLVAKASEQEIIDGHFLDSLALAPVLFSLPATGPLLDIGSGAGFPGLVLKAAYPELQVVLVEPRQKRSSFLRHIIRKLHLSGIDVYSLHLVPDDEAQQHKIGRYQLITSRALTDLGGFLSLAAAYCETAGFALCMKGRKATEEMNQWQKIQPDSPFTPFVRHSYLLPFSEIQRHILVFRRT